MAEKEKILVAEDNDFVRMQVVSFLKADGYEVVEATEGAAALSAVERDKDIGLALVDVRMEPVGGLEFVKTIRGKSVDIPVVFITGDRAVDLLEQAGKLGAVAVLMKPVMKERLLQVVERTLAAARRKV